LCLLCLLAGYVTLALYNRLTNSQSDIQTNTKTVSE
jgi:hypothetical protein